MKLNLKLKKAKTNSGRHNKWIQRISNPLQTLSTNRRAINAVMSNLILIAAVLVVGFAVLAWSQYQSSSYQTQYSSDVNDNIAQIQEKVIFEYIGQYSDGNLRVYLLNCGKQNVTILNVWVNGKISPTAVVLHPLGSESSVVTSLDVGKQAYFSISPYGSSPYVVKIQTGRESTFVGTS